MAAGPNPKVHRFRRPQDKWRPWLSKRNSEEERFATPTSRAARRSFVSIYSDEKGPFLCPLYIHSSIQLAERIDPSAGAKSLGSASLVSPPPMSN